VEHLLTQRDLPAEHYENLSIIQRNANRLERFVNQLLDLRKVQSGKANLNLSRVELVGFVKEIGECFKGIGTARSVAFCLDSDVASLFVRFDPDKMETVLYNLLSNAFKYAPVGTTVTVSINASAIPGEIALCVADQGCGVPDNDLLNIFNLYHESYHPDTRTLKGTGIGLALVKDFVELHGGSVVAQNGENGGLQIIMKIPLVTDAGSEEVNYTPAGYAADNLFLDRPSGKTIDDGVSIHLTNAEDTPLLLLVEDNDDMRKFIRTQLQSHYKVEVAENGKAGLDKAQKIMPDLILSDVMMPKLDGIQMLDMLKNNELTSHIPVILLSAKSAIESQVAGLTYGADYYITKPFNNAFLLAAVNNILNQRKKIVQKISSKQVVIDLNPDQVMVTSKDQLFLEKVISVVEEKMADPDFIIETVADEVNMARPTFFKKFKSLTQMAPVEFVRDMRLKRAKQYLDAGAGNITEVSYQVGFSSSKYFSTCFKAKYNMTPSEYQKQKSVNLLDS
jgi:CheY-like chemotaxis protein/AraC-like DNA-binding protein